MFPHFLNFIVQNSYLQLKVHFSIQNMTFKCQFDFYEKQINSYKNWNSGFSDNQNEVFGRSQFSV